MIRRNKTDRLTELGAGENHLMSSDGIEHRHPMQGSADTDPDVTTEGKNPIADNCVRLGELFGMRERGDIATRSAQSDETPQWDGLPSQQALAFLALLDTEVVDEKSQDK